MSKIYSFAPTWTGTFIAWGQRQRSKRMRRLVLRLTVAAILSGFVGAWFLAPQGWRTNLTETVTSQLQQAGLLPPSPLQPQPASALAALVPLTPAPDSALQSADQSEAVEAEQPATDRNDLTSRPRRAVARREVRSTDRARTPRTGGRDLGVAEIVGGVRTQASTLSTCVRVARQSGQLTPGPHTLVLSWTITPSGQVTGARMVGPTNLLGTTLRQCVPHQMSGWSFRAPSRVTPVTNFPMRIRVP